ncbi:tetratricopeptide repeat protein [Streptomyces sp. NPDC051987]|uniref:tetratricopeptide repeat protein n=1 Tax=Streptomyces sp. NPDC051987 TaxID=3155808 RepID=UPI003426E163
MRSGVRWMLVVVLSVVAFAAVFWLFYVVHVPSLPASDGDRVAVGVAAATVAATVGGTWGAWWAPRADRPAADPGPDAVRLELPRATVTVTGAAPAAEPAPPRVRMGDLPREPVGFQPRSELLAELTGVAARHDLTVVHAVTGARGVGKTQLAAAYARRRIEDGWPVVAWITAENSGQLTSGLAELADQLGVRQAGDDTVRAARAALTWIRRNPQHRCLLVLDNATDPDEVSRWLPTPGHAQVVVTATSRAFEYLAAARVDVTVFTEEEALAFLRERVGPDDDGAAELAAELGRLPLALAQAAHVIRSRGTGYRPYLARLRGYPLDAVLEKVPGERYPHRLAEAVLLAVEQAEQAGPPGAVRIVLEILSVLSPAGVPRELLHGAAREAGVEDPTAVADALGTLFQASLATDTGTDAPSLHRLVQRVVRERAGAALGPVAAAVARHLAEVRVPAQDAWEGREFASQLVDQIDALWAVLRDAPAAWPPDLWTDLVLLRRWAAYGHLRHVGSTTRALELAVRTRADCEAALDEDAPAVRHALELEGDMYSAARRSEQAVTAYVRRLALAERRLAPDDPGLAQARRDLAGAYLDSGRYERALPMYEELERDARRRYGPDHEETREALDSLANAYATAGRHREAVSVVERLADVLGGAGPSAGGPDSLRGLADAYHAVDEAEEGVAVLRRYVEECRLAHGPAARETLLARDRLARHCSDARLHAEAVTLARETVADAEDAFGPRAADTLRVRDTLAYCLQAADQDQEANDLYRRLIADETAVYGAEHTDVLRARRQLVWSLDQSIRHREAYEENRALAADHERVLGAEDPATLDVRYAHIGLCVRHGRVEEAVDRARELLADNQRLCGPRDPQTFQVGLALADALVAAGRHAEAEELLRDTVREAEHALSPDHPKVFAARARLAELLLTTGGLREAKELRERTVAEYTRLYGEDHLNVVWARVDLAGALECNEEYEAMLTLQRRITADVTRRWGEDHPATLLARRQLAWACDRAGRYEEEMVLAERGVADHDRHYGAGSLLAVIVRQELVRALLRTGHRRAFRRRLTRQLHTRLRRELGGEHPLTIGALEDMARDLRAAQRRLKALRLRGRALRAWEARSGPWSRDTVRACRMLGAANVSVGLVWRNAAVQKRLLDDLTDHFGPDHETTLTQGDWWIYALRTTGRWRRARQTARLRLAAYEGRYGPRHPWTLAARRVVAFTDRWTLHPRTSLAEYTALAEDRARVQGADHPLAVRARSDVALATLWTLRPHRALVLAGSVLADHVERHGAGSRQVRLFLRSYLPLCLFTGDLRRLRAALRHRRPPHRT